MRASFRFTSFMLGLLRLSIHSHIIRQDVLDGVDGQARFTALSTCEKLIGIVMCVNL